MCFPNHQKLGLLFFFRLTIQKQLHCLLPTLPPLRAYFFKRQEQRQVKWSEQKKKKDKTLKEGFRVRASFFNEQIQGTIATKLLSED